MVMGGLLWKEMSFFVLLRVFFLCCVYSVLLKRVMSDSVGTALVCTCDDEFRRLRLA